jgi:hypothetical protein
VSGAIENRYPHYNLTGFERSRAVALGAKPCSRAEIVAVYQQVRVEPARRPAAQ